MLKVGDRVLELDGTISIIKDIEDGSVFGCKFRLEANGTTYWIKYVPLKLTPLLEALV